jgi:type IX secretion system PorP/SprF family membrane protein
MKKLYTTLLIAACFIANKSFAQLQPLFDQYHFNQLVFNPAYAGSKGMLETNFFLHRQSTNIEGAPASESFTAHTPLANDKIGVGVKFFHDKIGVTNTNYLGLDYAYRMHINSNLTASVGLEVSIANYVVNYSELDAFADGDPTFTGATDSYWQPNAGLGIYLHSDNYYLGLSTVSLLGASDDDTQADGAPYDDYFDQTNVIYGTIGTMININDNFAIKPDAMVKMAAGLPTQLDANLSFIFNNMFLVGGGYRTNGSFSFTAQYIFEADNNITLHEAGLGYSYNTLNSEDAIFLSPSHEIFLVYRFDRKNNNIKNPRFF